MNKELFSEKLQKHINYRMDQSKIKITDLVLEELISYALEDSSNEHIYESGSHKKGSDIETEDQKFSIKSSKNQNETLTISSFRLTRFGDNLTSMIDFIDNDGKNFDNYLVLSRNETTEEVKYSFYILPSNIFSASSMNWIETFNRKGQVSGWNTTGDDNISLKIVKSMSNQLWISIKTEYLKDYLEFEITRNLSTLGKSRFIA